MMCAFDGSVRITENAATSAPTIMIHGRYFSQGRMPCQVSSLVDVSSTDVRYLIFCDILSVLLYHDLIIGPFLAFRYILV